ncbi:DUF1127 domain-containing protein [Ramlibacter sp. WS9]|nr:DUF1127 domain-containing protein [Ramlibacter sp. WS9]
MATRVRSWSRFSSRIRKADKRDQDSQLHKWQCSRQDACHELWEHIMIFRLLLSLWARRRGYTRAHEAQLRGMSDSELADLGIGRSQIPSVMCDDETWLTGVTSPGTGARTAGSPAAFPCARAAAGATCRLHHA